MSDLMRPVPFTELVERFFSEYTLNKNIFSFSPELSGPKNKAMIP